MKLRRLFSLASAGLVGLAATVLFASPASAHTSTIDVDFGCDVNTGAPTITWTITPSDQPGTHFGFRDVVTTPDAGTVTGIANEAGFPHANGDVITVKHELPAGFTGEVSISYTVAWDDEYDAKKSDKVTIETGDCPVIYTVTETCDTITFHFTAPEAPEPDDVPKLQALTPHSIDVTLTPSVGDPKTITLTEGGEDQTVSFPGSTGLTVKVDFEELFSKTHAFTHAPCPLPLTGSSTTGPLAIGGGLLVAGIALIAGLFLFRRRRTVASS